MAGPAIRSFELARALSSSCDVVLAAPGVPTVPEGIDADLELAGYDLRRPTALRSLIAGVDAVVAQPQWPTVAGWLHRSSARLIFDLYDPEPFELLASAYRRTKRTVLSAFALDRISGAMRSGHHLICASERQRDLWIGMLLAERRLGPGVYDADPDLRERLAVVPFGVPETPPARSVGGIGPRERFGLAADDEVILWNGGIWPWLDPATAIRAVASLVVRRPRVRLVFMGGDRGGPHAAAGEAARDLARSLGVLDRVVFFHDKWEPYTRRADWLLDADCALATHTDHLESRYAYRTRLVDCLWAGVPIVCTEGDEVAGLVEREALGATCGPGDPSTLGLALERVLDADPAAFAGGFASAARRQTWPVAAEPVISWVSCGTPAPVGRGTALDWAGGRHARPVRGVTYRARRALRRR